MEITATVTSGDPTHVIQIPEGFRVKGYDGPVVIITDSALEALYERDAASYFSLIHCSDELWEREWDWDNPITKEPRS